ncbi:hypothetical protein CC85DRAFT_284897 [Cutaneotrichosporon oleaginosum]|uniref:Uncharacterized protein n=1 Tax=Cutaneotrichosporon oleaginosum TaxID=879819 RepID=A0A0J0XPX4_9TREE|nr:uncharacterized protein CC85DRAFT_284897 [Cutaneotrichosporon oleaginosum]KLT43143.1 hypothetical protein CC85DRAFT_284897 [Cutaneotrichosporon oleaginosum]TXT10070.1 hypothetical protein COLE_04004 [Cutaneotrichosporon oleaginosum]
MTDDYEPGHPDATILVLHEAELDPSPFLSRIIGEETNGSGAEQADSEAEAGLTPWTISNKYYTASVSFRAHPLHLPLPDPHPVVLYLFSGAAPSPLPPALTRLSVADPAPDIALAVRLGADSSPEDDEERFNELGFELVDEAGDPEDDDERPLDPLETVRQTLMTHMWPTMVRKAPGRHAAGPEQRLPPGAEPRERVPTMDYATFPVTFGAGADGVEERPAGPASDFPVGCDAVSQDPAAQDADEDSDDGFGDFEGPGAEEYARLDEWLDGDGDEDMPVVRGEATSTHAPATAHTAPASSAPPAATLNGTSTAPTTGFEDDFDAHEASSDPNLPLDPTPILLHLQNVRAELADVEDEDERRVRAGAEVARLMRSLGLGGDDLGLDEFDDDDLRMP